VSAPTTKAAGRSVAAELASPIHTSPAAVANDSPTTRRRRSTRSPSGKIATSPSA
jgi:hypothetical protein